LQAEVAFPALVDELVDLLDNVVDELGSRAEVEHIRNIVRRGTSAQQQRRVYARALREGGSNEEALHAVVDHLAKQTMMGVR
jgi:carboxylate-amine ligase